MKIHNLLLLLFTAMPALWASEQRKNKLREHLGTRHDAVFLGPQNNLSFSNQRRQPFTGRYEVLQSKFNSSPATVTSVALPVTTTHLAVVPAQQKAACASAQIGITNDFNSLGIHLLSGLSICSSSTECIEAFYVKIPQGYRITYRKCIKGMFVEVTKSVDCNFNCTGYDMHGASAEDPKKLYAALKNEFSKAKCKKPGIVTALETL